MNQWAREEAIHILVGHEMDRQRQNAQRAENALDVIEMVPADRQEHIIDLFAPTGLDDFVERGTQ